MDMYTNIRQFIIKPAAFGGKKVGSRRKPLPKKVNNEMDLKAVLSRGFLSSKL